MSDLHPADRRPSSASPEPARRPVRLTSVALTICLLLTVVGVLLTVLG